MSSTINLRNVVALIVSELGCVHPFRISRFLVLINWKLTELLGYPLLRFHVEGLKAGFYIPELPKVIEDDPCFKRDKARGCITFTCSKPLLPSWLHELIKDILRSAEGLSDEELNRLVIRDSRYDELLKRGGFIRLS
ncbi:MAG: hypothetical protein DRO18_04755 [Thermoprotei archaeon]|nr:MAG: hypothetical protein DRO18_04755 [Thermoprotei archaeon]